MKAKRAWQRYRRLCALAQQGGREEAERGMEELLTLSLEPALAALCRNDLGVLLAARGETERAREQLELALQLDPNQAAARANLDRLPPPAEAPVTPVSPPPTRVPGDRPRIALVSLLFNWSSTGLGGGCVHTVGFAKALSAEGYEVRHYYARYPRLAIGQVEADPYPLVGEELAFTDATWSRESITKRFREAVDRFAPDLVVVTDSWSFKPRLAEAMHGYPVLLRFDGQELLCPLNNARLLYEAGGEFRQCPSHRLSNPEGCLRCLQERETQCGPLHRLERALSGVTEPGYQELLHQTLRDSSAVIVNNPLIREMLSPYATRVKAIPPGVEAGRFPWEDEGGPERDPGEPAVIFMAGVIEEPFKGYATLHEACSQLWKERQDFRLVATGGESGRRDEFTEWTGWLSQEALPQYYRQADICAVPSWVQDAWPTVAVEATAAGRPVVASHIGGLPFLVSEGVTGLLSEPGEVEGLRRNLTRLLDDRALRRRLGKEARRKFEEAGSWEAIFARHYRPLLAELLGSKAVAAEGASA